jgi:non-specific serine/threonine protein kinase
LIPDNCEHLLDGCARLADALLHACPHVRVLATSRELLGLSGEVAWRVPSLGLPPDGGPGTADDGAAGEASSAAESEAVRLFVERARAVDPAFVVTASSAGVLARVCRRLDGIPLAIELAAARVRVLSPEQIAARLDDRFRLLTGGSRTALRRQQTLRASIEWSHDLLADAERALLRRLAVFAGDWTLEGAEAICAFGAAGGAAGKTPSPNLQPPTPDHVLDLLTGLVDQSLVVAERRGAEARYRLLETIRQYAFERLVEAGEAAAVRDRHLAWCLALAERAEPELSGHQQLDWLDRLETEHDNLRAALDWAQASRDTERALRLAAALGPFWSLRGYATEGRERLIALVGPAGDAPVGPLAPRAKALNWASLLTQGGGDYRRAVPLAEAGLAASRALGEPRVLARALWGLGWLRGRLQDHAGGRALLEESVAVARAADDRWATAAALRWLGSFVHMELGEFAAARPMHEEALLLGRQAGDRNVVSWALEYLGVAEYFLGDLDRAERLLEESLGCCRDLGEEAGVARNLRNLARVALARGDMAAARELLARSTATFQRVGWLVFIPYVLEGFAGVAARAGQPARSLRLAGAAEALRESTGSRVPAGEQFELDGWLAPARRALGDRAAAAWAEGRAMTRDQAVADALSDQG